MKKLIILTFIFTLLFIPHQIFALNLKEVDQTLLSIKAGPTEPGEELSILWVEAILYPKEIKPGQNLTFGVELTSKVKNVGVQFDFDKIGIKLSSLNQTSWSGEYLINKSIPLGVHIAKFIITGKEGKTIQKTLTFFTKGEETEKEVKKASTEKGWPLELLSEINMLIQEGTIKKIAPDVKITGFYKEPWYFVKLESGEKGWLPVSKVKEPTWDYYLQGYGFYTVEAYSRAAENYEKSIGVDPDFVKGRYWLAKSLWKLGKEDQAISELKKVSEIDRGFLDARIFSTVLAQRYFKGGHIALKKGNFQEAVRLFKRVSDLKPSSITTYFELGESLQNLGLTEEARSAWKEVLRLDPENEKARSLVGIKYYEVLALERELSAKRKGERTKEISLDIPSKVQEEWIGIVKNGKTKKGTSISSAINSLLTLAESSGVTIDKIGWKSEVKEGKHVVSYICRQREKSKEREEVFVWDVNVDTNRFVAQNENAKLLMERW